MDEKVKQAFIDMSESSQDLWIPRRVESITNIEPLTFYRNYVARNIPVIIKGGCKHWPALTNWTNEYLTNKIKNKVTVALTPDGHGDAIKNNQFVLPFEASMNLGEFFDVLKDKSNVPYIQKQCSSLSTEYVELVSDVPRIQWADIAFGQEPDAINLWIGDERAISSTHKDPYENIYCVVSGTKEFTLLPPTDTPFLYRQHYPISQYNAQLEIVSTDQGTVPWVSVDPDNPDLVKFPLFQHASPIIATVEKGDILYLPSLWYHKVKQYPDANGRTIAVNFWYDMIFDARFTWSQFQDKMVGLI
ncbi:JmjC domain-containing protein 7 [Globomyces pollinis-pini]|nr:JmjC domain-containing protein 7 [Globomyces pollinis-pini]KAJ2995259.1 JmjC domain-containing protein 7 [Globomyces sp. JEL0801]